MRVTSVHGFAILATVLLGSASAAPAAIDVWSAGNATVDVEPVGANLYTIEIRQINDGSCLVAIDSTDTNDVIQQIEFLDSSIAVQNCTLVVRKPGPELDPSSIAGIESIDIEDPDTMILDAAAIIIDGYIGSPAGTRTFELSRCTRINVGGNWYADVVVDDRVSSAVTDVEVARTFGSLLGGSLINNSGSIDLVDVRGAASSFGGRTPEIWSSDSIDEVVVIGDAAARIGSNGFGFPGHSDVDLIEVGGDFLHSSMTMNSLDNMTVAGSYAAEVAISSPMNPAAEYAIGQDFVSNGLISLPSDGLKGQVVVNTTDGSFDWLGSVEVGSSTLMSDYSNLPASIGGGAVGVVPFSVHDQASAPASGSSTLHASDAPPAEAVAEYYGPVELLGAAPHFTIERRLDNGDPACPWVDVTSGFSASVVAGGQDRRVRFTPTSGSIDLVYEYRVTPEPGKVVCEGIDGDPDVAAEMYTFTLESDLEEDLTADGEVNATDLGILIAAWGQSCVRSDFNGDGDVGTFDLGTLIAAWTGEDPPPESPSGPSGSGHPVLDALGFDTIEGYRAWLETLTTAEMDAHLQDLLELVQAL